MGGQSAVYDDCLSGDIPGVIRGEKGNGSCHIFRFTQIRRGALSQKDVADVLIQIIQSGGSQYQSGCLRRCNGYSSCPVGWRIYLVRLMTPALLAP